MKQPPYPDVHRTVSVFVNYARALIASQRQESNNDNADIPNMPGQGENGSPSASDRGSDNSVTENPQPQRPPPMGVNSPYDSTRYQTGPTLQNANKDANMVSALSNELPATARPLVSRLPETMDAPNWTMSNSIADSFGLFEDGHNDIFDFLPTMPSMPQ